MTKIDYVRQTKYGLFYDAIYTDVELTTEQLETIKDERVKNYERLIETASDDGEDVY